MTLQETHTRLSAITAQLRAGLPSADVARLQNDLLALVDALPKTQEFDPTAEALAKLALQLQGQLTEAVIIELQNRTAILGVAAAVLTRVGNEAAADARRLRFEKPRLLAAGLKNGITIAQQLHAAAQRHDLLAVNQQAEALLAVLATLERDLKVE